MRRWLASMTREDGSAALEFILVGVILLVPVTYLVLALAAIQSHAFGAETTARVIAREIATADGDEDLTALSWRIMAQVAAEYDMDPALTQIDLSCTTPGPCPAAGATIVVTVTSSVALPFVPPVLGLDQVAQITVEGTAVQSLSRVWGDGE